MRTRTTVNGDGVEIEVQWDKFVVGASVFIPSLNMRRLIFDVMKAAHSEGMRITYTERVEAGYLGVRFWRIS